jgi:hypothetical protein
VRVPEWQRIFEVAITIGVAGAAFFGAAYLLRVAELRDVVDLVRRRLARSN